MPSQDPSPPSSTSDSTVRPPQQARSRRTLERLEKAALELVSRDGPDSVTVAQVVARARSSVGSFYARFQGKDELFLHLAEGLRREALERWEALDVGSAPDPVAATVAFLVEDESGGGGRRRALLAQGDAGADGGEFSGVVAGDLHRALAGRGGDGPSLEAVTLAVRVVRASLAALVAASPGGPGAASTGTAADGGKPVAPATLRPVLERVARVVLGGGGVGWRQEASAVTTPVPDEFREPVEEEGGADSGLPEAPLEDESPPVDPFDVWG